MLRVSPFHHFFRHTRGLIALLALGMAALACNLGVSTAPTPTPFVFITPPVIVVTATPTIGFATNTPAVVAPTQSFCVPNTSWQIYFVRAGDTLATIASRSGTTVAALVQANCLANPDVIVVGQGLRVPRQPVIITPTSAQPPTPIGPSIGSISLDPSIQRGVGQFQVAPGTITLRASGVSGAVRVVYYLQQVGSGAPVAIGEGTNPQNAFAVQWLVTAGNLTAQVWAVAIAANNQTAESPKLVVFSEAGFAPTIGTLTITPAQPDPTNPALRVLPIGQVLLTVSNASNATKVLFYFVDERPGNAPILLGEDTNFNDGIGIIFNTTPFASVPRGLIWAQAINSLGQSATTASSPVVIR
ncbi:MAG: LysM peptidoglycan-binding domain-containing protein [Chloroflexi bacterium CFX4]|nr:LysM peptidoglycan-binding domain-containing protein [Chloroflexi bacterium CFX4]MDL1923879.1 LysM peptidoglycan-binding domain-containing protein [Chloroflexi bacterium CFX3]